MTTNFFDGNLTLDSSNSRIGIGTTTPSTIFDKLDCKAPIVARANMYVHRNKRITSSPHIDTGWKNHKTAILYMNTNNGYTAFGKKKIMSKANRMLIFDSGTKHYAASQTDKDRRILININYF